ncbi:MAG: 16S rRNA (guanine(527)-N(7))-methyltransferase RsmG [Synergistaceae bacterium]|jgi:16S rRNA (guanine527-N7)-methyltransferase|nr:16S rRNA (guanine(527)-N(7))-methyltransferase RsmG [Synergistaceae bacterium]
MSESEIEIEADRLEREWETALRRYAEILASYPAARLTGTADAEEIYGLHIRDCLHSVPLLPRGDGRGAGQGSELKVVDVGSGGGLPGMVWAVCRPDLRVTLLDSVGKKCRAMEEAAAELGLANVSVIRSRCEEYAADRDARESCAFAAARAVAHAGVLAEYLSPLVSPGGRLAAFKGPRGEEELREVGNRWAALGLSRPRLIPYDPRVRRPGPSPRSYFFAVWEKDEPCPPTSPRRPGLARTKPWWSTPRG